MKEKSKFDKLKKGIGVGILAGTLGLANVSGSNDSMNLDDSEQGTKIKNSILLDKPINLNLKDGISLEDNKVPNKKFFEKRISEMEVDDSLKPILVDILMRRSLEYELNKEEIERDLNRLNNNVEEIIVDDNEGKDWGGLTTPAERTIRLGTTYLDAIKLDKNNRAILYETLTHEVYHALDYNEEDDKFGLEGEDGFVNRPLHEIIVEKAADRMLSENNSLINLPHEWNYTNGYRNSTFITDIIESTYGVTEKEFLSSAIKGGKERLIKTLANKVGEEPEETKKFLEDIQTHFNTQFYLYYYKEEETKKNVDKDKVKISMANIYKVSINKMNSLIQNKKLNNLEETKEYVENLKYNYNKLNRTMEQSLSIQRIQGTVYDSAFRETISDRAILENRIHNMDEILKYSNEIESKENILKMLNDAKDNKISKEDENIKKIDEKSKIKRSKIKSNLQIDGNLRNEYNIGITDCEYWENRDKSNFFWNIGIENSNVKTKEKYIKSDSHKKWNNEEVGNQLKDGYMKLYSEHKKESRFKSGIRFMRAAKNYYTAKIKNIVKTWFKNIKDKVFLKKAPLMLNSGEEEKHTRTLEDQKKEFMDEIKVDLVKMKSLKDEKSMSTIDKNKEKKEEIERTI